MDFIKKCQQQQICSLIHILQKKSDPIQSNDFWRRKLTLKVKFWYFLTAPHYSNFQNLVISFEYSWFLAKNLTNFVSLHWKLHNRYCNTWDILIRILYSKSCSSAKSHVIQIIHGIVVHVRSDIRWIELKFLVFFFFLKLFCLFKDYLKSFYLDFKLCVGNFFQTPSGSKLFGFCSFIKIQWPIINM